MPKLRELQEVRSLNPPIVHGDFSAKFIRQRAEAMAAEPVKVPVILTWKESFNQKVGTEMKYEFLHILKELDDVIIKHPHIPKEREVRMVLGPKRRTEDFTSH